MLFHDNTTPTNENQFVLYQLPEEEGVIQVVIKDESIWATQKAMASLFGVDKSGISRHIANILKEGELKQEMTVAKIATVINRGKRGEVEELVDFYNLDMIISVGYRVNSAKATKFRIWATGVLKEYIRKGFALDDNRLKNLGGGGFPYLRQSIITGPCSVLLAILTVRPSSANMIFWKCSEASSKSQSSVPCRDEKWPSISLPALHALANSAA